MRQLVFIFFITSMVIGCIPREKVIYLQNSKEFTYAPQDSLPLQERYLYRVQPGDVLSIKLLSITPEKFNLKKIDDQNREESPLLSGYLVDEKGNLDVPYIGVLNVAGLTMDEIREKLKSMAQSKLINPQINIRLLTYTYTILGEVNRPGTFSSYKDQVTVFEALGQCGDMTDFADRAFTKLIRQKGDKSVVTYLNLLEDDFLSSEDYYLRPGDILYVPPLKAKNFNKYQLPNIALSASILTVISLFLIRIN